MSYIYIIIGVLLGIVGVMGLLTYKKRVKRLGDATVVIGSSLLILVGLLFIVQELI
jgi:hypothetical protein